MKVITIGRSTENNDIVVNDEKVSRNHLQMVMDDNGNYSVVDLGSTNGTYVNGQRISGEVRLRPDDEVRIGQTVLPWQNYFVTSSQPPIVNPPMPPLPPKPKPNHTWIYIVIGAVLLLLISGGMIWKVYHDKQEEKIEQEEKDKKDRQERQLEQEANDARVEAARLSEEAEAAARKAAETKSKEDLARADAMRIKAEEANKLAQQKVAEWNKMNAELDAANKAVDDAMQQSKEDREAKDKAIKEVEDAQNAAKKAEEAKQKMEKQAELTKKFYRQIAEVKPKIAIWQPDYYQKICDKMDWKPSSGENKKDYIIERFEKANDDEKQRIINAVEQVLHIQNNEALDVDPADEIKDMPESDTDVTPNDTTVKGQ